jgi:hypothetical protein
MLLMMAGNGHRLLKVWPPYLLTQNKYCQALGEIRSNVKITNKAVHKHMRCFNLINECYSCIGEVKTPKAYWGYGQPNSLRLLPLYVNKEDPLERQ